VPPTAIHFNGSVNLGAAEAVMREITSRVPAGVRRIPDGETGDRRLWIHFQLQRFLRTPGLEEVGTSGEGYAALPKVRVAAGADVDAISWPDLGYAEDYRQSFETFGRLRKEADRPGPRPPDVGCLHRVRDGPGRTGRDPGSAGHAPRDPGRGCSPVTPSGSSRRPSAGQPPRSCATGCRAW
jgi:hypothetical protein